MKKLLKKWIEPLYTAWVGIIAHKLRSFLTILGIVIGVGAVIALMSIGKGVEAQVISSIQGLGTNLIFVQPGFVNAQGVRSQSANNLTLEDSEAIAIDIEHVQSTSVASMNFVQIVVGSNNTRSRVNGITPSYQENLNLKISVGDLISDFDYRSANKVAVIGPNVADTLFPGMNPVGQKIRVSNYMFQVVGVLEKKGTGMMSSTDDAVLIPVTTMWRTISKGKTTQGRSIVDSIYVQVTDQKYTSIVMDDINNLLRSRHRIQQGQDNDFTATSQEDLVKTMTQAMQGITFLLGAIAAISLLVGGIGVMNIMLVSVMERTREIGIRKALGALENEIVIQFLIEASLLTLTGGVLGILLGWGVSRLVANLVSSLTTMVTPDIVFLAFIISVGIGLIFGIYPAWRGSRLNPIEALRYE
jgi:putative ABC transport system permease protein